MSVQKDMPTQLRPGLIETHQILIASTAVVLMLLPFVTAFSEFLTSLTLSSGAYLVIQDFVVPIEGRMVAGILHYLFGMPTAVSGPTVIIPGSIRVYINWNCIGWQSLVLFGITLVTGLRGPYTTKSKALCVITGLEGTVLLSLVRIASVVLVAIYIGYMPALLFHDYGGTILTVLWLVAFWSLAFNHILKRPQ